MYSYIDRNLLTKKENELRKAVSDLLRKPFKGFIIFVLLGVASKILMYLTASSDMFLALFVCLPAAIFFSVYSIVYLCVNLTRKSKAPQRIENLVPDIKELRTRLLGETSAETKADNTDLVMAYKSLLDAGIITKEEYETKKNYLE